jgi:DNA mismatch endonuclease (patch repair protein)
MERRLRQTLPEGRFADVQPRHRRTFSAVRSTGNRSTEKLLRMALIRGRISGWVLHEPLPGKPDFFFQEKRLVVFTDGCYWHGCPRCGHIPAKNVSYWTSKISGNQARDRRNEQALANLGITVLRFWEHELTDDITSCVARIRTTLENLASAERRRDVLQTDERMDKPSG